ncbi:MAG: hypothetical protein EPN97_16725 [Alphaproteobacteria bacterium]|nr:MAG: hypothetical protein EPN97_16725 [Alphaproteobacteria bacterium]
MTNNMPFGKIKFLRAAATGVFLTMLVLPPAASAQAGGVCRTPDGFSFLAAAQNPPATPPAKDERKDGKGIGGTGVTADRGMGGTGIDVANGKGIGGTGITTDRGVGGTGIDVANGKGIGGTGVRFEGGIAVHGRITGFGSICVDGLEIKFSNATPVQDGARKMSAADLKVGQVVSVVAAPAGEGLMARSIAVDTLVTGKLISIDAAHRTLNVAGQKVTVTNLEKVANSLTPGHSISVSGFKTGRNGIVATFINRQPHASAAHASPALGAAPHAAIQGFVTHKDNAGLTVGSAKVAIPENARVIGGTRGGIAENDRVIVIGRHEAGGGITAEIVAIEHRDIPAEISDLRDSESHVPHQGKSDTGKERSGDDGGSGSGHDDGDSGSGSDGGDSGSGRDGGGFEHESGSDRSGSDRPEIDGHEGSGGGDR